MAPGANRRSRGIPSVPVRAPSQRSAERTAPSIPAVGTPDIITPVGVGKGAIRTAGPCVDSLQVKVGRSDPGELSSSAHSRRSRASRSALRGWLRGLRARRSTAVSRSLTVLCAILRAPHASSVSVHPLRKPGPVHSRGGLTPPRLQCQVRRHDQTRCLWSLLFSVLTGGLCLCWEDPGSNENTESALGEPGARLEETFAHVKFAESITQCKVRQRKIKVIKSNPGLKKISSESLFIISLFSL